MGEQQFKRAGGRWMSRIVATGILSLVVSAPLSVDAQSTSEVLQGIANQVIQQQVGTTTNTTTGSLIGAGLSDADIGSGLREALSRGTRVAVTQLGHTDGFWGNQRFRIPLPRPVEKASTVLQAAGYGPQIDALHLQMNRAAEQAVPLAADVFAQAAQQLTLADVRNILNGPQDAATQFFRRTTYDTLATRFQPIVTSMTGRIGVVQQYNNLLGQAGPMAALMGVDSSSADLNAFVTRKALDGLFLRVGDEERNIRSNPAGTGSALLQRVFGTRR